MFYAEAREMLTESFTAEELANKVNTIVEPTRDGLDFTPAQANVLIDWLADKLTDEGKISENGKGSTG